MCSQQTVEEAGRMFAQVHLHPGPKSYGHEASVTIFELLMMWSRVSNGMSWTTLVAAMISSAGSLLKAK